jgi:hypothetical protein
MVTKKNVEAATQAMIQDEPSPPPIIIVAEEVEAEEFQI